MRLLTRISLVVMAFALVIFSSGCEEDTPGGGGVTLPPTITLNSGPDLVSFNQELPLSNPSFRVSISGEDGDAPLRDLVIQEDGLTIPFSQLTFNSGQTSNNPIAIASGDQNGFIYEVTITPSNTQPGPVEFTFRLTDTNNEVATTSVTITYTQQLPMVTLVDEAGFVTSGDTVSTLNPTFTARVTLDDTANPLETLTILEGGTIVDASRLTFNGGAFTALNPLTLLPEESTGVTFDITIDSPGAMEGSTTYTFEVADDQGNVGFADLVITFITPATDLTFDANGIFFNASGSGNGGLDLDTGTAVAFNSTEAEIEDEGIDLNMAGENWRTQISATNDAVIRTVDLSTLGDGVTYDDVVLTSEIESLFDGGAAPTGSDNFPDADGDTSASEIVTEPMQEGDVYAVRRGDRTYLIRIDEINFVANSNDDSYTISIKY
ncbi:hypothetical protein [Lewinella sp. W8]|uniref:hypothetical protein n=1 Tax=Lewinella sp. W8 TaxID=2528208 RepID=UPI0010689CF5|nr:hypothetical protein [Lewinella sp. W8]MTB52882.1 hypothetical protein [Lewinella sp. W8]